MRLKNSFYLAFSLLLVHNTVSSQSGVTFYKPPMPAMWNDAFSLTIGKTGISGLWKSADVHPTNYIRKGQEWGNLLVRYRNVEGVMDSIQALEFINEGEPIVRSNTFSYGKKLPGKDLAFKQEFKLNGTELTWTFTLTNHAATAIEIDDIQIPVYYNNLSGENSKEIFEERVVKHHFIAGDASFMFFLRPTGKGPFLLMLPQKGTALEYYSLSRQREVGEVFNAYIHSRYSGEKENRGTWRQEHTGLSLSPAGTNGSSVTYGFSLHWAHDYEHLRQVIYEQGGMDIKVVPGMTVPNDLEAKFSLQTKAPIQSIIPEFPKQTTIRFLEKKTDDTYIYQVKFNKLGENKLTINYGNNQSTLLEFFSTEPLETLYKKRTAFLVNSQQHRTPDKWYDGLYSIWDMRTGVLRGPDNTDWFE